MKNTYSFYSFLAFGCYYNMALVSDCLLLELTVICCPVLMSPGICNPRLSSGGGCGRARGAVTECCSRWVFQQSSSSSCYLPPTWCSILTMPAVNWGLPLTIFIRSLSPFCICAVGRLLFVSRTASYLSFAFFSLVFSSIDVFHVLLGFFSPLNNFFFLFSISFLQLSAVEEEAVPFLWLFVSCQLNLLPI